MCRTPINCCRLSAKERRILGASAPGVAIMEQTFSEVENTDPGIHAKWLAKHGFTPDEEGKFSVDGFQGKDAVTTEKLFAHIKENSELGLEALMVEPYDERVFVMVCGGPSLANHLEEIRRKAGHPEHYLVVCSNMTAKYLLDNGITPHVHFILDPTAMKCHDVDIGKTSPDTEYWINVSCNPLVFKVLEAQGIKPKIFLAAFDSEGKDFEAFHEGMKKDPNFKGLTAIQGGTMAGLRAINLADARGFRKMQYYGFDATVEVKDGKARPYAYEKKRGEAIIEVQCDLCPEKFATTLVFQRQVNEFIKWVDLMPWIDVKIIGGGLISHYWDHLVHDRNKKRVTHRFTPEYIKLQKELHAVGNYGVSGIAHSPAIYHGIMQLAKRFPKRVDVLDYGSSSGHTTSKIRKEFYLPGHVYFWNYDPAVDQFATEPGLNHFVICSDVMEHVEPECTWAVLDHLKEVTQCIIFFSISLVPARKVLSDGRNAHINLRDPEFWLREIKKRFITSEAQVSKDGAELLVVAQAIQDVRQIYRDIKKAEELAANPDMVIL